MSQIHFDKIAKELNVQIRQVDAVVTLLDEGATIPFISRYRKERTGSLDEVKISDIRDRIDQLRDLDKRRESILKSIEEQGKLTEELKKKINKAENMALLEDLYLPYKPKRKTRASIAREKGLEPLATKIYEQNGFDPAEFAASFISAEKGVESVEAALQGARDIIAEQVNENQEIRSQMREMFWTDGVIKSKVIKGKEAEAQKYKDYFEWEEKISKIPSHRLMAIRRGEREMFLVVDIAPDEETAIFKIEKKVVTGYGPDCEQVKIAAKDAYKRLLKPSMETETRLKSKMGADEDAIKVFSENLYQLLLAAPLGRKNVLGVDPGFRTGCKIVCLDKQGKLLAKDTIYPNAPQNDRYSAIQTVQHLIEIHQVEAIAIGNGTASRETESFFKSIGLSNDVIVAVVNEAGASIYSASEVARQEFPDHDLTVRGAVSIGRRIMDPLAELVKIDPKSIGVGQYQHDVDQNALKKSLDDVVQSCVNKVGVELNTASKELLTYVSGLGPQLAQNIVNHRNENGPFKTRNDLKKVTRLGEKAFEQAAGFLRISDGANVLDASAVHPERYSLVETMAKDLNSQIKDLISDAALRKKISLKNYITEEVGLPTLNDIISELDKPGRDPREKFEMFSFAEGINEIGDLKVGMELPGIVTNITKFGAFVDVGVHQDGLVHISELSNQFVSDPAKVVKLQQKVKVRVVEVDVARKRIALSMKDQAQQRPTGKKKRTPKKETQDDFQSKLAMLKGKFGG